MGIAHSLFLLADKSLRTKGSRKNNFTKLAFARLTACPSGRVESSAKRRAARWARG